MTNEILNRGIAPDSKAIENIHLIKPEHTRLPNGCELYCFNSGDQELVRIEWIFGNLRFDPSKPLLNMAVNTMLTDGTSTLSAAEIADNIDFYGAFFSTEYGFDHSQVTLHSLNKHLKEVLPIVKDVLSDSVFPENELETYVRNQQQKLQVNLQKNDVVARRAFNKAVYGDTLYGLAVEPEEYNALRRDDLLAHFKQMYQPANCTLIVAGKIDDATLQQLTQVFGNDWQNATDVALTTQPEVAPTEEKFYFIEKPEALQSAIRIGIPFIKRDHPDFAAMQVLNTVLGGYFGSRLMTNIREEKGYTYGIGSGMSSLKHGAAFFIATEVGADVCRDAVAEIEKEVNLLKSDLIPQEEISLVQNYMLGSLLGSLENVFSHADKFKNLHFSGVGYEYYDHYAETVKAITADKLQQLAKQYFNFDDFYKVIVGKY
ncbi:M16 family metallopeptidase [Mucilaginibacter sp. HD30]